jgi:hypothetical protein
MGSIGRPTSKARVSATLIPPYHLSIRFQKRITFRNCRIVVSELIEREVEEQVPSIGNDSLSEDAETDDPVAIRPPFEKPFNLISDWIDAAEPSKTSEPVPEGVFDMLRHVEETLQNREEEYLPREGHLLHQERVPPREHPPLQKQLPCLPDYKTFIISSESYRWLMSKICQQERLSFGDHNVMSEIGSKVQKELRVYASLHKMSHRRPLSSVQVDFLIPWNPRWRDKDKMHKSLRSNVLKSTICISGSWCEAQAMSVTEYMRQTWPVVGEATIHLFEKLLTLPDNVVSTCKCHYNCIERLA